MSRITTTRNSVSQKINRVFCFISQGKPPETRLDTFGETKFIVGSSNGRTTPFEGVYGGSNPPPTTNITECRPVNR